MSTNTGGGGLTGQDSAQLWNAILPLGNQVAEQNASLVDRIGRVDFKLDDLPDRARKLEVKILLSRGGLL
jgi:hypothetical protein